MTRILTIIALLFATPAWADDCIIYADKAMSFASLKAAAKGCKSGQIVNIMGDYAFSIVPKVCRYDRQIVKLMEAQTRDLSATAAEREEWWTCIAR
jgi:hypothetical protein